jgi:hypothetical protein
MVTTMAKAACLLAGLLAADRAAGNGGPFLIQYPDGDPAAKGVLARLDPTLKPAQETRLRVVKEDLSVLFPPRSVHPKEETAIPPAAHVSAAYLIENPTDEPVEVDFGFPILRGIYVVRGMGLWPAVSVAVDKKFTQMDVISNSVIYGVIRRLARGAIDKAIESDSELARLVRGVQGARQPHSTLVLSGPGVVQPPVSDEEALRDYLVAKLRWSQRDAALMVQYASLDFGPGKSDPRDQWCPPFSYHFDKAVAEIVKANLGPLSAIGEQKATQFFAQLASRFDPSVAGTYEAIFEAWGGDVRQRAVDLRTGRLRPRETDVDADKTAAARVDPGWRGPSNAELDTTVYARVDYLDPKAPLNKAEKAACLAVLKNLPVTFTFAPMNLLHYRVAFPPKSTRVVTVSYAQYAYTDTANGGSYQLAYVLHPATLWKEFGPIHLTVRAPKGVACKASVPLERGAAMAKADDVPRDLADKTDAYKAVLDTPDNKRGELFIGIDRAGWDASSPPPANNRRPSAQQAAPRLNLQPQQSP